MCIDSLRSVDQRVSEVGLSKNIYIVAGSDLNLDGSRVKELYTESEAIRPSCDYWSESCLKLVLL